MPDSSPADTEQTRLAVEKVIKAMRLQYEGQFSPVAPEPKMPPALKLAGSIVAGIMTVGCAGLLFWMITSISQMQLVLARMDERQSSNTTNWEAKFRSLDERMGRLETQKEKRDDR